MEKQLKTAIENWPIDEGGALTNPVTGEVFIIAWRVDPAGFLVTPAGTRVARITQKAIYLLDRKFGTGLPFTRAHWEALFPK
jgi:DNA-binding beta-propeller fold protein YncE